MNLTSEQNDLVRAFIGTNNNILVQARAGTGKTTTNSLLAKYISPKKKTLVVAFSKDMAEEFKTKFPEYVETSTLHSLGLRILRHSVRHIKIDFNKQFNEICAMYKDKISGGDKRVWLEIFAIDKVVSILRCSMIDLNKREALVILRKHGLDHYDGEELQKAFSIIRKLRKIGRVSEQSPLAIDFQNMIELPCVHNLSFKEYDNIFCDEVQDFSLIDHELIKRVSHERTRTIFTGDYFQSIYMFRGASPEIFQGIADQPNITSFPLTICWRSDEAIIKEAQKIVPDIRVREGAGKGFVTEGLVDDINEGDLVLCRTSMPLLSCYYQLIELGLSATIVGKDIEKGLIRFIDAYDVDGRVESLLDQMDIQYMSLVERGAKKLVINEFEEKFKSILIMSKDCQTISEVKYKIEDMFEDKKRNQVKLMTIHKSKGLENDTVFLITHYDDKPLMPHPSAETPEQRQQEMNLLYVARTRAKKELYYLKMEDF